MDTLKQVREIVAAYVGTSGACADEQIVLDGINEARRILYELGDWEGTTMPLCIKTHCGLLTLPANYTHATKGFVACRPIQVINDWFTPVADYESACGRATNIIKQEGEYVTFQDWPCIPTKKCCNPQGFRLKVVFENAADDGVRLKFYGRGVHVHEVSVEKIAQQPWINTPQTNREPAFLSLTRVVKPETQGRIRVYGYDGFVNDPTNERLLAVYDPNWINPSFCRYNVSRGISSVIVKAKRKYVPLRNDDELVDIHVDAIIHTLQALTERKAKQLGNYNSNLKMATDLLNRQLGNKQATSTAPMQMSSAYRVEGLI